MELFFLAPDGAMMAADIRVVNGRIEATVPQRLFGTGLGSTTHELPYAVTAAGQRFLIPVAADPPGAAPISVVMDWPGRLRDTGRGRDGGGAAATDFGALSRALARARRSAPRS